MSRLNPYFPIIYRRKKLYKPRTLSGKKDSVLDRIASREHAMEIIFHFNKFNWKHQQRRKKIRSIKPMLIKIMKSYNTIS